MLGIFIHIQYSFVVRIDKNSYFSENFATCLLSDNFDHVRKNKSSKS